VGETTTTHLSVQDRWLTTGLLGIGLVTFAINGSITNLILSKLMTSMRVELYNIHWVVTAFSIARTITIPALGWMGGRVGPRSLYLGCLSGFTLGMLGSSLAWDWPSLLFFRMIAGACGGLIPPLSMAIFYQIFPPNQRGMALGLSLMGWSIGPTIGPLTGGYLLEFASWRAAFAVIVPLSGIGLLAAWWLLPSLQRPERRTLDVYGLFSVAVAVTTYLIALSQGRRQGWDSEGILILLAVAAVAALIFVVTELRSPEPLVELRLLASPPFLMAVAVMCITTMAFRSTGPMMPVLMQRLLGFEPLLVAWTMLPSQIVYGLVVLLAGRLSDRVPPTVLVVSGLLLYAGAFIGFSNLTIWTTSLSVSLFLIMRFIAEGLIVSPNNLTAMRALPEHQVMMAAGLIGLLRSVSNTLGPAVASVLWDQHYSRYIQHIAERSPMDSFAFTTALRQFQHNLTWLGEGASQVPVKSLALMGRLMQTEASTAAWQAYLLWNGMLALIAIVPALLVANRLWRRVRVWQMASEPEAVEPATSVSRSVAG
jgi:EmrB/QacA subfamily drug resistance transporter